MVTLNLTTRLVAILIAAVTVAGQPLEIEGGPVAGSCPLPVHRSAGRAGRGTDKDVVDAAALNDFIEIGAFAKPEKDQRYGKVLPRERILMQAGKRQYQSAVDEEPEKAGIDPLRLLIDRVPDDNMKKVTVVG